MPGMDVDRAGDSSGIRLRAHVVGARSLQLVRDMTDVSASPWRDAPRARRTTMIVTAVVAVPMIGVDATFFGEVAHLPVIVALVLAAVRSVPMPLSAIRPVLAWWLSIAAVVGYTLLGWLMPLWAHPLGAWESPLVTHLVVSVVVAAQARPLVVAAQWVITMLAATEMPAPQAVHINAGWFTALLLIGLAWVGIVRSRRQLRRQQALTERERDRRSLLEERTRIARELHDVVAHHMSVVAVQAEAAPYRVADAPPELQESFASIRENAVAALDEMRHILGMLRAEEPDSAQHYAPQPGLGNVGELLDNVRAAGLDVALVGHGVPGPLPELVELSVFRIVQEALSNALRHAPGSRVEVELDYRSDGVAVRVSNTLPPDRPPRSPLSSGHGLNGMRERASALGGVLTAGSREDGWFEVTASIPCDVTGDEDKPA